MTFTLVSENGLARPNPQGGRNAEALATVG
jgi:hypothetical protein